MRNLLTEAQPAMPKSMVAGDSLRVNWVDLASAYPAGNGYTVSVIFVPEAGGTSTQIEAEAGSGVWSLILPGATSADWAPGPFRWAIKVEGAAGRFTPDNGIIQILPDPASTADARSHARRVLDAIERAIEGRASRTDLETTLADGRQIKRMSHKELLDMRDAYARKVANEDRRKGRGGPRRVLVSL